MLEVEELFDFELLVEFCAEKVATQGGVDALKRFNDLRSENNFLKFVQQPRTRHTACNVFFAIHKKRSKIIQDSSRFISAKKLFKKIRKLWNYEKKED